MELELFHDLHFWVAVSFVIFVTLVFKVAKNAINNALTSRIQTIKLDLDDASTLRDEAEALLAIYQEKKKNFLKEAQEIQKHSEYEVKRIEEEFDVNLKHQLAKKLEIAKEKLQVLENDIMSELNSIALEKALYTAEIKIKQAIEKDANLSNQIQQQAFSQVLAKL